MDGPQSRISAFRKDARRAVTAVMLLITFSVLPFATHILPNNPSFNPVVLAVVLIAYVLTALLLFNQYTLSGRGRQALAGGAYLFASCMIVVNVFSVPGVVSSVGPLAVTQSVAGWTWTFWHLGFIVGITGAFAFGDKLNGTSVLPNQRKRIVIFTSAVSVVVAAALACLTILTPHLLPTVIVNNDFSRLRGIVGPIAVGVCCIAIVVIARNSRTEMGTDRWIAVASAAAGSDVLLTLAGGSRYTIGWYGGRGLAIVTSLVVLCSFINELSRAHRKAENDKRVLEDEALDLMREKRTLKSQGDRIRRIIENAADAYIEVDAKGVIYGWNEKASELFGWQANDVIGSPALHLLVSPGSIDSVYTEFKAVLASASNNNKEQWMNFTARRADDVEFPIELHAWLDTSGAEPRVCTFARDITVRKQAEERMTKALADERKAVLRLQELDRVRNDFVSSISHELRTPLTSTLGYLEMLNDGIAGELSQEQAHMVGVAERNGQRLLSLIEDLLTLSRIEQGEFRVRFRPVEVQTVLANIEQRGRILAGDRSVAFDMSVTDELGLTPGDDVQLQRAISGVVDNAIKFTPPGGSVSVNARCVEDQVVITVVDTGIGIPVDEQHGVFDRFFRSSIAVEQQHQGAGLGLTIAKAVIEHHGGSIKLKSSFGYGTTAEISLPAISATATV